MPRTDRPLRHKTQAELSYIIRDAGEAARAMSGHDERAEAKYLDQVNDAQSELGYRMKRCPRCKGYGCIQPRGMREPTRCPRCNGVGKVLPLETYPAFNRAGREIRVTVPERELDS